MSSILRTIDQVGMVNQKGFEILIQILSLKIYDEKETKKRQTVFWIFTLQQKKIILNLWPINHYKHL